MGHVTEGKIGDVAKAGMLRGGASDGQKEDAIRRLSAWPTDKSFVGSLPSLDAETNGDGSRIELQTGRMGVMFRRRIIDWISLQRRGQLRAGYDT